MADNILLLSATISDSIMEDIESVYGKFLTSKITLNDAITWNLLSTPKIYIIPLYLNSGKYDCEIIEEWGKGKKKTIHCNFSERWKYIKNKDLYPNTKLIIRCTQKQKYDSS